MIRIQSCSAALLLLSWALALDRYTHTVHAAVLPRVPPGEGAASATPTPLPIVSTYTLYFGNGGATVQSPVVTQTVMPPTSSTFTQPSPLSTSGPKKCSKKKQLSAAVSPPAGSVGSSSVASRIRARVLPHSFMNKVDALVEAYHGLTGRKARQLALVLANQTGVIANVPRTNMILSHLDRSYRSHNDSGSPISISTSEDAPPSSSTPHLLSASVGESNLTLVSNTPFYGPSEVRHDLHVIRAWASDLSQLSTPPLLDETVAAIFSASSRYYPELCTRDAARVIMADIKAESDFDPTNVSGGRLDSGSSWGLMQVSPFGSGELRLFQQHARVRSNTGPWSPGWKDVGPLLDWDTGKVLDVERLTNEDLFRPWVNVHVASWIQSNLARTSSQDPYSWADIYAKMNSTNETLTSQALVGARLSRSFLTGLGSWVAGPAVDGYGSYTQTGDDISKPYFKNIVQGLSVLYGHKVDVDWLDGLTLRAGLVDYH